MVYIHVLYIDIPKFQNTILYVPKLLPFSCLWFSHLLIAFGIEKYIYTYIIYTCIYINNIYIYILYIYIYI